MKPLIDIHNHTLWAMDDGIKTKEDALQQLFIAHQSNIQTIAVTPHIQPEGRFVFDKETIIQATEKLTQLAKEHAIPITIRYGSEFLLTNQSLSKIKEHIVPYQDTNWVLVEQRSVSNSTRLMVDGIDQMLYLHKRVLIAHVERYFETISEAIETCTLWRKRGAYMQINRTSIIGMETGLRTKIARALIKHNLCHVIASDAHRTTGSRILKLDDSHQWISRNVSLSVADLLHHDNPRRLLENEDLIDPPHERQGVISRLLFR